MHVHNCSNCGAIERQFGGPKDTASQCFLCVAVERDLLHPMSAEEPLCQTCAEEAERGRPEAERVIEFIENEAKEMRQLIDDLKKPSN